ncbi:restriction endonuclease subunit S [Micromonospora aurantiaca (nom. illeg.)]|uniref:restriction endonuclease subunit S n=1 Tax=Micromonospora aurantiaca (nom. illeg.) TaxID=47850 RepID=UPI003F49F559
MTQAVGWKSVPFWTLYKRDKKTGFPAEELLSVYRDYGVIKKSERNDNWNRAGEDMSAYQLVEPGDLVLNKMKTWQGSLGVSSLRGIVSPAYFVYKPQTDDDPRFLHYALRSVHCIGFYASISKGIRPNQWDLQPEMLDSMRVFLPDIDTQREIAASLAKVDSMIATLDKLSDALRQRTADTAAVFGLIDGYSSKVEGARSPLQGVPEHWGRTKFGYDFFESTERNGGDPVGPLLSISEYRGVELNTRTDGQQASLDVSNYRVVRPNQLAANMMWLNHGGLGVSSLMGYISPDYKAFWISPRFYPRYVHHLLRSPRYVDYFGTIGTGVRPNAQRVTKTALDMTPLPLPPLEEQKRIADQLDEVTASIDRMLDKVSTLRRLLIERRGTLITNILIDRGVKA